MLPTSPKLKHARRSTVSGQNADRHDHGKSADDAAYGISQAIWRSGMDDMKILALLKMQLLVDQTIFAGFLMESTRLSQLCT